MLNHSNKLSWKNKKDLSSSERRQSKIKASSPSSQWDAIPGTDMNSLTRETLWRPYDQYYHVFGCPNVWTALLQRWDDLRLKCMRQRALLAQEGGQLRKSHKGCPTLNEDYWLRAEFPQRSGLGQALAFPKWFAKWGKPWVTNIENLYLALVHLWAYCMFLSYMGYSWSAYCMPDRSPLTPIETQ